MAKLRNIGDFLYNLISVRVGGIELDFEQIDNSTANNKGKTGLSADQ